MVAVIARGPCRSGSSFPSNPKRDPWYQTFESFNAGLFPKFVLRFRKNTQDCFSEVGVYAVTKDIANRAEPYCEKSVKLINVESFDESDP